MGSVRALRAPRYAFSNSHKVTIPPFIILNLYTSEERRRRYLADGKMVDDERDDDDV